jgi:hypothetical protein
MTTHADPHTVTCLLPDDRPALSLVGANRFRDGDEFRDDGWVYGPDGECRRKWFGNIVDNGIIGRIWEPALRDIAAMERRRWAVVSREDSPARIAARAALRTKLVAHHEKGDCVHVFTYHPGPPGRAGMSHVSRYRKELEGPLANEPLGRDLYHTELHDRTVWRRRSLFNAAFMMAAKLRFGLVRPHSSLLHATINGRHYWFNYACNRHGVARITRLTFPEDIVEAEEMGNADTR